MIKKTYVFLLLALFAVCSTTKAQDPEFSQFFAAPLHLNPALTGIAFGPRVNLIYRNEWPAIEKGYVTYAASFDMHIDKIKSGIGISLYNDRIAGGLLNYYSADLNYSYQIRLSRNFGLKLGVYGGVKHQQLNWAGLTFSDQINPLFGFQDEFGNEITTAEPTPGDLGKLYPDFGTGLVIFNKNLYGGLAIKHITQPDQSFSNTGDARLPIRSAAHFGAEIDLAKKNRQDDVYLVPNILFAQQSNFTQLNIGSYLNVNMIFGGFWFRHNFTNPDAVIALLGVKVGYFKVGYSYDFTVSRLSPASSGSHEVSLTFVMGGEDNSLNPRRNAGRLDCPRFLNF